MYLKSLVTILAVLLVLAGCGNKGAEEAAKENAAKLEKLNRDLVSANETITTLKGELSGRIGELEDNTKAILDILNRKGSMAATTVKPRDPSEGEPDMSANEIDALALDLSRMTDSMTALAEQLAQFKDQMNTIAAANEDVQRAAERREQWERMNDPEKLAATLDEFSKAYSEKMIAAGTSPYEFQQDMAALKNTIEQPGTPEQQKQKYVDEWTARLAEEEDERRKQWLQDRIDDLNNAEGEQLEDMVSNYQRFNNMRQIGEIAEKYEISRDDLREAGIMVWGRPGGGRGRGEGGGRTGGGRTGGGGPSGAGQ